MTVIKDRTKAVFGPVPSRRLGMSLGVDLVTHKTCTLDCVYCELGPTTNRTVERGRFRDADEVLGQVEQRLAELDYRPDYLTLAGSGEPTLHLDLARVLTELKRMSNAKLAVLTNGTLAPDPRVRADLCLADLVIPSLDAVSPEVFRRINRPHPDLEPEKIIQGLEDLKNEHPGEFWLEILLAGGFNDHEPEIKKLVQAADEIAPDKIQLNTVVRPPVLDSALPLGESRLKGIAARFQAPCEVIAPPSGGAGVDRGRLERELVEMTGRRPCTIEDIQAMAGLGRLEAAELMDRLVSEGKVNKEQFDERTYYRGVGLVE